MTSTLSADAVVVGSGAAGLVAALAMARDGLDTLVLERSTQLGGTSAMSGGLIYAPGSRLARDAGRETDPGDVVRYLSAVARRPMDLERVNAFLAAAPEMVDELIDSGVAMRLTGLLDYYRDAPGAGGGRVVATEPFDPAELAQTSDLVRRSPYRDTETGPWIQGMSLIGHLVKACLAAGVRFETRVRARELTRRDGAVVGVVATRDDAPLTISSPQGVVLASGGFEFDQDLVARYVGPALEGAWSSPWNEGDALRMAASAGAALTGLGEAQWYALLRLTGDRLEGRPLFNDASPARHLPGSIAVGPDGRRFANEGDLFQAFGRALVEGPGAHTPAWLVMDQRFVDAYGSRCFGEQQLSRPEWVSAASIAQLAAMLGLPAEQLSQTIQRFNDGAKDGLDPDFGRGESAVDREWGDTSIEGGRACLAPLTQAPFHATRIYAGCSGTTGGPKVDSGAKVLGEDGNVIPGLYAVGNATEGMFGDSSPASGATLGPGMTFGFIAAKAIARSPRKVAVGGR